MIRSGRDIELGMEGRLIGNGRNSFGQENAIISRKSGAGVWGMKPDLVAPGVNIMTTAVDGGYKSVTGTSFATPFFSGAAALLMEWGRKV